VVRAALDESATRALVEMFPHARIDVEATYGGGERKVRARHKGYEAYQRIVLTTPPQNKAGLYGDLLRAMLADQMAFLTDRTRTRTTTEVNGRDSLRMSVEATVLASAG
jgi:hypothetical protein